MPPIGRALVWPWELVATIRNFSFGAVFNYAVVSHAYYVVVGGIIFFYGLKSLSGIKRWLVLAFAIANTCSMFYVFELENGMLYSTCIQTISLVVFWSLKTAKEDYPRDIFSSFILFVKIFADIFVILAYSDFGTVACILSLLLLSMDVIHFYVFALPFIKKEKIPEKVKPAQKKVMHHKKRRK